MANTKTMALMRRFRKLRQTVRPPGQDKVPPVSQKVLRTYELLHHILHALDPPSLRQARLVSSFWCGIVLDAPSLKARATQAEEPRLIRTVLVGTSSSGVTALVERLIAGPTAACPPDPDPRWEPGFRKQLLVDGELWMIDGVADEYLDREGHWTNYLGHTLARSDTYVLLYAVSSSDSFDKVKAWLAQMSSSTEPLSMLVTTNQKDRRRASDMQPCLPGALISTKNDLPASCREVEPSEAASFARHLGCPLIETSASTGDGVERAFADMCRTYKRARLEHLHQRSKRVSLIKSPSLTAPYDRERRERWFRWYRTRHTQSR